MTRPSDIEVIVPYGRSKASQHLRFIDDYVTFCGRNCEGWSAGDMSFGQAIDSPYTCQRCIDGALK